MKKNKKEKEKKISILSILFYTLVIGYAVITIGPFIWSFITSLKPTTDVNTLGINFSHLSFKNYAFVWNNFPFGRWFFNSIFISGAVTLGNLLFNSMAGYALARIEFPGKKTLFLLIIAIMMIPGQVVMVPTYMLLAKLGWINTYKGLVIPFLTSVMGIFLMRQFFLGIPKSMEESAQLDGLGRFGIFFRIILPLAGPALSTQFILLFTGNWNSFMWPSLIAVDQNMYTLPVGLNSFYGQYFQFWNQVLAGVMILSIPALIVFLIFQKNFIKGISTTGMKE
ncbi:carbohydrate ABC transporter permease [Clostridium psychrophilum]|uniref:carbohydrate ABC transporter permease n=1 Tax=Clostridium psychrophilum TaxID=132926 RepID=UPI001C0D887D|nr:carbohydrate ABC transporter permease [Clostridium psychrophilum]MBU3180188.1 carbohydrate ABC transporter permease [Clostridium psychrophilum]